MTHPVILALERARAAQEAHERRIDVQLRVVDPCPSCGLDVIQTGACRHPCAYCGGPLTRDGAL